MTRRARGERAVAYEVVVAVAAAAAAWREVDTSCLVFEERAEARSGRLAWGLGLIWEEVAAKMWLGLLI